MKSPNFLPIIYAPNDIFRKKAENVDVVDDNIRSLVDMMLKTMYMEKAVGLGANMLGLLKRIAIVDVHQNKESRPLILINPEITTFSQETQTFMESSLSFPGIEALITRPKSIEVKYLNYEGTLQELTTEGFLATVIQHEIDYLNGIVFLDYLSKLKRDSLLKKMEKFLKMNSPHVHSNACRH